MPSLENEFSTWKRKLNKAQTDSIKIDPEPYYEVVLLLPEHLIDRALNMSNTNLLFQEALISLFRDQSLTYLMVDPTDTTLDELDTIIQKEKYKEQNDIENIEIKVMSFSEEDPCVGRFMLVDINRLNSKLNT